MESSASAMVVTVTVTVTVVVCVFPAFVYVSRTVTRRSGGSARDARSRGTGSVSEGRGFGWSSARPHGIGGLGVLLSAVV